MTKDTAIKLFNDNQIRTIWDDDKEKWFCSVVDVVGVLTESPNPRKYWSRSNTVVFLKILSMRPSKTPIIFMLIVKVSWFTKNL